MRNIASCQHIYKKLKKKYDRLSQFICIPILESILTDNIRKLNETFIMMSTRLKTTDISMATKTIRDSRFFITSRLVKSVNISFNRTLKFTILRYVSFPSNLYPQKTAYILRLHYWVPHKGNDV